MAAVTSRENALYNENSLKRLKICFELRGITLYSATFIFLLLTVKI